MKLLSLALPIAVATLCAGTAAAAAGAGKAQSGADPWNAPNVIQRFETFMYQPSQSSTESSGPPTTHSAGDRWTEQWFTPWGDGGIEEHTEIDRWQHPDAPINGPADGGTPGSYDWVPVYEEEHVMADAECVKLLHVNCVSE